MVLFSGEELSLLDPALLNAGISDGHGAPGSYAGRSDFFHASFIIIGLVFLNMLWLREHDNV